MSFSRARVGLGNRAGRRQARREDPTALEARRDESGVPAIGEGSREIRIPRDCRGRAKEREVRHVCLPRGEGRRAN